MTIMRCYNRQLLNKHCVINIKVGFAGFYIGVHGYVKLQLLYLYFVNTESIKYMVIAAENACCGVMG